MRQLWLRKRRAQVRLVVTAVSAIVLVVVGDSFAAEGSLAPTTPTSTLSAAASGRCSKATAGQVATRFHVGVDASTGRTPIAQVLCGPFFGPGSRGMVASVAIPSCGQSIEWAVFRFTGGRWRLVMKRPHGAALEAVGSDIRETQGVLRGNDAHCFPSATRSRIWHWTGTRFRASRWKVTPASLQHLYSFLS